MQPKNIIPYLQELKTNLKGLKAKSYTEGTDQLSDVNNKIRDVIKRVYTNPKEAEKKLFPKGIYIADSSAGEAAGEISDESYNQKQYFEGIKQAMKAMNTMLAEFRLFEAEGAETKEGTLEPIEEFFRE